MNTTKPTHKPPRQTESSSYGAFGIKKTEPTTTNSGVSSTTNAGRRFAFGDNYGNARDFTRPDEEQKKSTKHVSELKTEMPKLGAMGKAHSQLQEKDSLAITNGKFGYKSVGL